MTATFRFVLVGSGNIANTYVHAIRRVPEASLVGVVSRSRTRPAELRPDERIEVCDSLKDLRAPFDAVILATPNAHHPEGVAEAAALGKHALSEKPLAITLAAADLAIQACRSAGVTLGVCFQRRMSPDNITVQKLIGAGALGRVLAADVAVKFYRDQAYYDSAPYRGTLAGDGGGAFIQQASHQVDLYRWFFGRPLEVKSTMATLAHRLEAEDHGAAVMTHPNGMIGTFVASTVARPGFPPRVEIHTEAGSVLMVNDRITDWLVDGIPNPSAPVAMPIHSGAGLGGAKVGDTSGHEAIIADFIGAVREGRPPAVTGEEARQSTELILDIYAAARR